MPPLTNLLNNAPQKPPIKVSTAEMVLVLTISGMIDALDAALSFIPGLGWISNFFINLMATALIQLYLMLRGLKWYYSIVGNLIEFIPVLNILPLRTVGLALTFALTQSTYSTAAARIIRSRSGGAMLRKVTSRVNPEEAAAALQYISSTTAAKTPPEDG